MIFKEFRNPEERDYDINSSLNNNKSFSNSPSNQYSYQLAELIGLLEDVSEEELQELYGISMKEYFKPTAETIKKVTQKLNQYSKHR